MESLPLRRLIVFWDVDQVLHAGIGAVSVSRNFDLEKFNAALDALEADALKMGFAISHGLCTSKSSYDDLVEDLLDVLGHRCLFVETVDGKVQVSSIKDVEDGRYRYTHLTKWSSEGIRAVLKKAVPLVRADWHKSLLYQDLRTIDTPLSMKLPLSSAIVVSPVLDDEAKQFREGKPVTIDLTVWNAASWKRTMMSHFAKRLDLPLDHLFFVDDCPENCREAETAGLNVMHTPRISRGRSNDKQKNRVKRFHRVLDDLCRRVRDKCKALKHTADRALEEERQLVLFLSIWTKKNELRNARMARLIMPGSETAQAGAGAGACAGESSVARESLSFSEVESPCPLVSKSLSELSRKERQSVLAVRDSLLKCDVSELLFEVA